MSYTYSNNFDHFASFNGAVSINIVHLIGPFKFLLGSTSRGDVNCQKKFLEVNFTGVVFIKGSEYVGAKFLRVAIREESGVNFDELLFTQLTGGTVTLKSIKRAQIKLIYGAR